MVVKINRLIKSFTYAWRGLFKVLKEEQNLKIQTFAGLVAIFFAAYFKITRLEWLSLILVIGLVLVMETVNSAVERVTDVLKPRINNYVKEIKDIMAAAVMLASLVAFIVGLLIFFPKFFGLY